MPQMSDPIKATAAVVCFLSPAAEAAADDTATRTAVEVAFRARERASTAAALDDAVVAAADTSAS